MMKMHKTTYMKTGLLLSLASTALGQSYCDPGYSLEFDGGGDHARVPYDASFPTEVFTVIAWVRTSGSFGRRAIVARGEDGVTGNASWNLYMQADGTFELRIEDANDDDFSYASGINIDDDSWHQVAATRDTAGTVELYVDGLGVGSFASTGVPSSFNQQFLTFGCTNGAFGPPSMSNVVVPRWFFPGQIDEPSIWNVALSAAQIQGIYSGGVDLGSPGLVGFWRLDESIGQTLFDGSPFGNDGYRGGDPNIDAADPVWVSESPTIVSYCPSLPNSTGIVATIGIAGSTSIVANNFILTAQGATPNQFAVFFYGPEQAQTPLGDGFLCIGAGTAGFFRLPPVQLIDGNGRATCGVDFGVAPAIAGAGGILPGAAWNFQMWYRDQSGAGGAGSNLTDAVSVTFCH